MIPCRPSRRSFLFTHIGQTDIQPSARPVLLAFAIAGCWLMMLASASAERSVTLAWDRSPDSAAVGYRIYAREENITTPTSINVLGLTQATVPGLKEGRRYTFTVTSYNAAGLESPHSNAAEFVVPVPLKLLPGASTSAPKRLQFPMVSGRWYEVQASTNLKSWTTIWQTGTSSTYAWAEYQDIDSAIPVDPRGAYFPKRYYRLKIR